MTVAPQKDIWPHGNTYPTNAVPIAVSRISSPDNQTSGIFIVELK